MVMRTSVSFKGASSGFLLFIILIVPGCSTHIGSHLSASAIASLNERVGRQPAPLGAGDELSIKCYHNQKLDTDVTIRPDGSISLQLIGEIKAAGKTPLELTSAINSEYIKVFRKSLNGYSLGVGDQLSIKFYYNKELNEELTIRPDGMISLQLVGEVTAAGLTPTMLQDRLRAAYGKLLEFPEVAVIVRQFQIPEVSLTVRQFASRRVYVGGEVAKPGVIPITGMLRTLDAVLQAGGALPSAKLDNVIVIRYNGTSKPDVLALDQKMVLKGKLPDLQLQPYDVVYLPKTAIAHADLFVEQYLNRIIPHSVSFPFVYNFNPEVRVR